MLEFLGHVLGFLLKAMQIVWEIDALWRFVRTAVTGRDGPAPQPAPAPKVLSPEAQRALAEAEERREQQQGA